MDDHGQFGASKYPAALNLQRRVSATRTGDSGQRSPRLFVERNPIATPFNAHVVVRAGLPLAPDRQAHNLKVAGSNPAPTTK